MSMNKKKVPINEEELEKKSIKLYEAKKVIYFWNISACRQIFYYFSSIAYMSSCTQAEIKENFMSQINFDASMI